MKGKKIMSIKTRQELTESFRSDYRSGSKSERSKLLDVLCKSCQYNKKTV